MATISLAMVILLYFMYLSFWPISVVNLNSGPTITPKSVTAGDEVAISMDFTKKKTYKPTVKYYLICNERTVPLTQDGTNRRIGRNKVTVYKTIPIETKTFDDCRIQIDISYIITPFRTINYIWNTDRFSINAK